MEINIGVFAGNDNRHILYLPWGRSGKTFDGSLPKFLTAFLSGRKLSEQEAEELKRIIEEAVK